MTSNQPKPLSQLPGSLVEAIERRSAGLDLALRPVFLEFAAIFFGRLESTPSRVISSEVLATVASDTFQLIARRKVGPVVLTVGRIDVDGAGGSNEAIAAHPLSVVTAVNEDKPFLVSSIMGEIQSRSLNSLLVLHPVHAARRNEDGDILAIKPLTAMSDADQADGWRAESVIVVIAEPIDDAASQGLAQSLRDILAQVDAAVRDWRPMIDRLDAAVASLQKRTAGASAGLLGETVAFCNWMRQGQFVFLGMREYRLDGAPETGSLKVVEGSGLGILSDPSIHVLRRGRELVSLTDEVRRFYLKPSPIIITKSNVASRVHRRAHMDYVGLKIYGSDGRLSGELRMVGLFTAAAYTAPPNEIPFLRLKVDRVFDQTGIKRASHEGRMLQHILDTFPRDELFQIGVAQLAGWAPALLALEFDPQIRAFVRRDRFDRFVSIVAFVERDRFSTAVRERIGDLLAEIFEGRLVAHQPFFTAGPLVRVHFIVGRYEGETPIVDEREIERRIAGIVETWEDRLDKRLSVLPGGMEHFAGAFSSSYAEMFAPERALEDIERIERLGTDGPVAIDFYREPDAPEEEIRAAVYRFDHPIPLSDRVPILENLGFSVIDERTYRITPRWNGAARGVCLHDMVLKVASGGTIDLARLEVALEEAFVAVFLNHADNDTFNRLVMAAGLTWHEASILRAYAGYMRQVGLPHGRVYIAETLVKHAHRAADLIRLFKARFDTAVQASEEERTRVESQLMVSFEGHLAEVASLDEDRILRSLLGLVRATVRTNFFKRDAEGKPPEVLAFKIATRDVADAPEPRPFREIWVSGPELDGVHLRFASIARGGLRWSERAQDFRTEVLGLAKAQQVKNTVIVPQGAKGGFVPKLPPADASRDAMMKVGIAAYRRFISTLLDMTDNLDHGTIVPPRDVVRRDGDDPYLVVAADKGTATFSDYANALSQDHDFWLDDAFASGGSAGYDHKKMGITARGAWECVKRHFREMGRDIQQEPFSVAGVGDMSGDVFGNGMLLSRHIRLVAAFDHRDIFVDPQPDPETSYAERERLFKLPRSSWQDYDRSLLSQGGGIFSRSAKSIEVSPEIRAALSLRVAKLTPNELMRAILEADVDLIWFGGIGTYVRGNLQTDADAGDRGNDAIRIPAQRLRAKVVGEGANLGLTQSARIDFSLANGRINTDFIDNAAGVNSSDQEVNIKIALAPAIASGRLDRTRRNALLTRMTDDVANACLANNYAQSLAISLSEQRGSAGTSDVVHLMQQLERRSLLDRALEVLPSDADLQERASAGGAMTRPELAVLLSYAKLAFSYDLIGSSIPDDAAVAHELMAYFPPELQESYGPEIEAHPLKREIVTTAVVNEVINVLGPDLPARLADDWDLDVAEVAQASITALEVCDARRLFQLIHAEDNRLPGMVQLALYGEVQRLVRERAQWCGSVLRQLPGLAAGIDRQKRIYGELLKDTEAWMSSERSALLSAARAGWVGDGATETLASELAQAAALWESGDVALIAEAAGVADDGEAILKLASCYVHVGDHFRLSELRQRGFRIDRSDRFDRLAVNSALSSIAASHRKMASAVMTDDRLRDVTDVSKAAEAVIESWRRASGGLLGKVERRLNDIAESGPLTVARLTVASALVRELAEAASTST